MIINRRTGFAIEKPKEILQMPEHTRDDLRQMDTRDYIFFIPTDITDNRMKSVYKVGFLKSFYTLLFPDLSLIKIFRKINIDWQVFLATRQMERLSSRYLEEFEEGRH